MRLRYTLFASACLAMDTARCAGGPADAKGALRAGAVARLDDVRFWWKNCYMNSLAFSPDSKTLAVAASRCQALG
jgi:sugar lactone lactonase YvrE